MAHVRVLHTSHPTSRHATFLTLKLSIARCFAPHVRRTCLVPNVFANPLRSLAFLRRHKFGNQIIVQKKLTTLIHTLKALGTAEHQDVWVVDFGRMCGAYTPVSSAVTAGFFRALQIVKLAFIKAPSTKKYGQSSEGVTGGEGGESRESRRASKGKGREAGKKTSSAAATSGATAVASGSSSAVHNIQRTHVLDRIELVRAIEAVRAMCATMPHVPSKNMEEALRKDAFAITHKTTGRQTEVVEMEAFTHRIFVALELEHRIQEEGYLALFDEFDVDDSGTLELHEFQRLFHKKATTGDGSTTSATAKALSSKLTPAMIRKLFLLSACYSNHETKDDSAEDAKMYRSDFLIMARKLLQPFMFQAKAGNDSQSESQTMKSAVLHTLHTVEIRKLFRRQCILHIFGEPSVRNNGGNHDEPDDDDSDNGNDSDASDEEKAEFDEKMPLPPERMGALLDSANLSSLASQDVLSIQRRLAAVVDGTSGISFETFYQWWRDFHLRKAFNSFDAGHTGSIARPKGRDVMAKIGVFMSDDEWIDALAVMNPRLPGRLAYEDFLRWWEQNDIEYGFDKEVARRLERLKQEQMWMMATPGMSTRKLRTNFEAVGGGGGGGGDGGGDGDGYGGTGQDGDAGASCDSSINGGSSPAAARLRPSERTSPKGTPFIDLDGVGRFVRQMGIILSDEEARRSIGALAKTIKRRKIEEGGGRVDDADWAQVVLDNSEEAQVMEVELRDILPWILLLRTNVERSHRDTLVTKQATVSKLLSRFRAKQDHSMTNMFAPRRTSVSLRVGSSAVGEVGGDSGGSDIEDSIGAGMHDGRKNDSHLSVDETMSMLRSQKAAMLRRIAEEYNLSLDVLRTAYLEDVVEEVEEGLGLG